MRRAFASLVIGALVFPLLPAALAQVPAAPTSEELLMTASVSPGGMLVSRYTQPNLPKEAEFSFSFEDDSIEHSVTSGSTLVPHRVTAWLTWDGNPPEGWSFDTPTYAPIQLLAGESGSGAFFVKHLTTVTQAEVHGILNLRLENPQTGASVMVQVPWLIIVAPSPAGLIEIDSPQKEVVRPYELVHARLHITNTDVYPATYRVSAVVYAADGIDPSDIAIGGLGDRFLQPGETRTVDVVFQTPRAQFWYNSVPMTIQFGVADPSGGGSQTRIYTVTVSGFYWNESLVLLFVAMLAQVLLFVWLLVFARRRYEKRYLGRPLPPWEIPEEAAHLDRLKRQDPRAHYVLRYFLMEEEYRSALLWFHTYKKLNKKQLKADIRAVELKERADQLAAAPDERFAKASERLQRRHARRMERAQERTERQIARLQARLERSFEKDFEKDHSTWEARVEKLQKKHNRPYFKAKKKWEAATAKILAKWEKPFRKEKERHAKALAKAKEAYAAKVKRKDRPVYRQWRLQMEDWREENKVRKAEGREVLAEPELRSEIVGPPELPAPFLEPPKPELPPEPVPVPLDLPPEPVLATPDLATSHHARAAAKVEREGRARVRAIELELAKALQDLRGRRLAAGEKVERRREKILEAAEVRPATVGFVDRVLRRSPEAIDRRHHVAFIRANTKERAKQLAEVEEAHLERARVENERAESDLESKLLLARAKGGDAGAVEALSRRLEEARAKGTERLAQARKASKERLAKGLAALKADEKDAIERELGKGAPAPEAEPAAS